MGRKRTDIDPARAGLLLPVEVGRLYRVDAKTPVRWALAGILEDVIRIVETPGGHRLFDRDDLVTLLGEDVVSGDDPLVKPVEVGGTFRVDSKTVVRWAQEKRLESVRTPSGHYRFRRSVVDERIKAKAKDKRTS